MPKALGDIKTNTQRLEHTGAQWVTLREALTDWVTLRNFQGRVQTARQVDLMLAHMEKDYADG